MAKNGEETILKTPKTAARLALACVASVSVEFKSKELPPLSYFGSRPNFARAKYRSLVFLSSPTPRKRLLRRLGWPKISNTARRYNKDKNLENYDSKVQMYARSGSCNPLQLFEKLTRTN